MLEKLKLIEERYEEMNSRVSLPEIIADNELWRKLCKEISDLQPIVDKFREYNKVKSAIDGAREMLAETTDKDFRDLIESEIQENSQQLEEILEELKVLLLPRDPNDDKNVIVEIRGGAGGDEAALFASVLYRMYTMYAETKRWKVEIMDVNETELGGFKEIVFLIKGKEVYGRLKFESGVHRVQRIPTTESSGRIHTSTITVAVLPEAEDVDIEINTSDLRIDVYRASGAGGQHVNKTESAVRVTHIPTGTVVACQSERSQHQNKETCMRILRSKIYEQVLEQQNKEIAQNRKSQVGTGDRSERIRTYNYPQGRVTDHRVGLTLHRLEAVLNGDLEEIIDTLIRADHAEKLRSGTE